MTLTNPNCPVAGSMPESIGKAVEGIDRPIFNKSIISLVPQVE